MGYEAALNKSWSDLSDYKSVDNFTIRFLSKEYEIDLNKRMVSALTGDYSIKDSIKILLLHYINRKLKGLPSISGQWISFQELEASRPYYPVFKKRVIDVIAGKYGPNPGALLQAAAGFGAKRVQSADYSIVIEATAKVPILISLWEADEEFPAEANLLFDSNIKEIFCTEDIVVLAELIAHGI